MNRKTYDISVLSILFIGLVSAIPQQDGISFSKSPSKSTAKKTAKISTDAVKLNTEIGLRAASNCYNCECQCDSYGWTNKNNQFFGNCVSADKTGAKFCYVSGRSKRACRDVQQSQYRRDSFSGSKKFYSYEACTTPAKQQCYRLQNNNQNCGDGDALAGGGFGGNYPNGNHPNNNFPNGHNQNNNNYPNNNYPNGGYPNNNRPNDNYPVNNNYPNNNYPNANRPSNNYPNNWSNQQQQQQNFGGSGLIPRDGNNQKEVGNKVTLKKESSSNDDSVVTFESA